MKASQLESFGKKITINASKAEKLLLTGEAAAS